MVRLGGAYYGNPYKNNDLTSNIMQLGGGLGYRNKGIFIDLGYAYVLIKMLIFLTATRPRKYVCYVQQQSKQLVADRWL
jgi:hypothetical protein